MVDNGVSTLKEHCLSFELGIFDLFSTELSNAHGTFIESLLVAKFLSFGKLISILPGRDFEFFTCLGSSHVSVSRNVDNGDGLEVFNPVLFDVEFLSQSLLGLEVVEHCKIIGRV